MQVNGYPEFLEIVLFPTETEILRSIMHEIDRTYALPLDKLEASVRGVWYSGEGFRSVEMNDEDRAEWNESLAEFRGQNRLRCQEWKALLAKGGDPLLWRIGREDADILLTVFNDYRLYQAATHHIGQSEMDLDLARVESPMQRMALLEIHFLAWLMEMILRAMNPERQET